MSDSDINSTSSSSSCSTDPEQEELMHRILQNAEHMDHNTLILVMAYLLIRRRRLRRCDDTTSDEDEEEENQHGMSSQVALHNGNSALRSRQVATRATNQTSQKTNSRQTAPAKLSNVAKSTGTSGQSQSRLRTAEAGTSRPILKQQGPSRSQNILSQRGQHSTAKHVPQNSQLTVQNVAAHNAKYSSKYPNDNKSKNSPQFTSLHQGSRTTTNARETSKISSFMGGIHRLPEKGVKRKHEQDDQCKPGDAGPSKRSASTSSDGGKPKGRRRKIPKTSHDEEVERALQEEAEPEEEAEKDPLNMIDIVETVIKEEVMEPEEGIESAVEDMASAGAAPFYGQFETIYCTPDPVKMEFDDNPTSSRAESLPRIKQEPRDVEEELGGGAGMMWRCPVVTCPEMFSSEIEMYRHINLYHAVKGPALPSKSKKAGPPVLPTGCVLVTSPVSASCGGPVVVTTTVTTTSTPLVSTTVTTTCSLPLMSTASASHSARPSSAYVTAVDTQLSSEATPLSESVTTEANPLSASVTNKVNPLSISVSTEDNPLSASVTTEANTLSVSVTTEANPRSASVTTEVNPLSASGPHHPQVDTASITAQNSGASSTIILLTPGQKQIETTNPTSAHIFNPTESTIKDLPSCATDDSEMFSISLARFPQERRTVIKQKLINVVDCVQQKNISADKIVIAYYEDKTGSRAA